MNYLSLILSIKIVGTLVMVVFPFLFLDKTKVDKLTGMTSTNASLYRLYGVAILSLLVAYAGGIIYSNNGVLPWGVIAMGLVSNVGATTVLILTGTWKKNVFPTVFFGVIAGLLVWAALNPESAMQSPF